MENNGLGNFRNTPLFWRAVNRHPAQQAGSNSYHSLDRLGDFFKNERFFSMSWLFLNHPNSSAFDRVRKEMPIDLIFRQMISLARPVYTDFIETNEEPEFLKVCADFYRELFWTEKIFISFNFFNDSSNYELKEGKEEPEELEALREIGGFDIWVKLTNNELDRDRGFMHLKTGITVDIPDWRKKLAKCMWCGDTIYNFENWFQYSVTYLSTLKQLDNFNRMLVKRIKVEASGDNPTEAIEDIEAKMGSISTTITVRQEHNADIIAVEYANGQDLESLHYTSFNTLDRLAYELGRVSNTNPKGERLTSGENYKDISSIANRQKATLEQLKLFAHQVKEMWKIDLNFAVSGIPEKEILEMENPSAPNPNTEGSSAGMAGGAEGGGAH